MPVPVTTMPAAKVLVEVRLVTMALLTAVVPVTALGLSAGRSTQGHRAEAGKIIRGVIGETDQCLRKLLRQLHHSAQAHKVRWSRVEVGGVQ
jgi:hypothetical protein